MSTLLLDSGQPGPATQTELGLVIQATDAEVAAGLNTGKYITPAALKNAGALVLGLGSAAFENTSSAVFNASKLQGRDVSAAAPSNGQVLSWNSSTAAWEPSADSAGVTSVSADAPLSSSGGSTPNISLTGVVDVAHGGTGASTASGARTNLSAAVSGANGDITSLTGITGGISSPDFIQLDTAATPTPAAGMLFWNDADGAGTLSVALKGGNVIQNVGEDQFYRVKASSAITAGQVVMFTGVVGVSGQVTGAPATGLAYNEGDHIMGVAAESAVLNGWCAVKSFGFVRGIDTTGGAEAWVAGDILYWNPAVAGGLTKVIPTAPAARVQVAVVVLVHASNGELLVRITAGSVLGGTDSNVQFSTLTNNDFISYNSSTSRWENVNGATARTKLGLGSISTQDASNVSITGGSITGIADLAVVDGGTGAGTAAGARVNILPSLTGNASKVLAVNTGETDVAWVAQTALAVATVGSSAPASPTQGQLWWNQDTGQLKIWYNDGTSSQWVDVGS